MVFDKVLTAIAVAVSADFFVAEALAQRPVAPPPTGRVLTNLALKEPAV